MPKKIAWKRDYGTAAAMAAGLAIMSAVVYFRRIALPADGDYGSHVVFAQQLYEGRLGEIPLHILAHPGLQLLLGLIHLLSLENLGFYASLMVVQVAANVGTALILFFWIGDAVDGRFTRLRAAIAAGVTLAAPVPLLAPIDGLFYFGYIGLANYHNPTIHLLRPVALASFVLACQAMGGGRSSTGRVVLAALLMVFSLLIKPNFAVCVLPAVALASWLRRKDPLPPDWRMLVFGFFLPAGVLLMSQWLVAYGLAPGVESGFVVLPLAVERAFSDNLAPKLVLSLAFPLGVLIAYPRGIRHDLATSVSWLAFLVGAVQLYLLAEAGDRFYHGNFRWGAQITLFLLFAASARFLLQLQTASTDGADRKQLLGWGLFCVHVLAGIIYYVHVMVSSSYA